MNKLFFYVFCAIMAILPFIYNNALEARHHHRKNHVQVGIGIHAREDVVVRRCIRPVVARPLVVPQRVYYAPAYVYDAPAYAAPVYVDEVYAVPRSRPLTISGLSLSFNLFK